VESKGQIIDEIRNLHVSTKAEDTPIEDGEFLRIHKCLGLLDELIEEISYSSIRDLPDTLIHKASLFRRLGRFNDAHELLLEAYQLETRNYATYFAMMALYRQLGATDCADGWMHRYMIEIATHHGHIR
jgi:tetratricopeptide (TPR) repeat protein